ncbi:MAG TPA: AraC family transcriptional regulator [Sphingomonas sp.]|jgi:AraC-like DNA-binding protein|nr:AraC family transcriptional regulator [Sphingomonas sp.]
MDALSWPIERVPQIVVAGQFALADRDFATGYRGADHALHLHGYDGTMLLGGERRQIAAGDVTISPAGALSAYDLPKAGLHWCIHFRPAEGGAAVDLPLHVTGAGGWVREAMAHAAALHARAAGDPLVAAQAGLALQATLLQLAAAERPPANPAERAAALIAERFADPLDVATIAAAVGRNPAHLARLFRRHYGETIPHRLIARRVDHARFLLESSDLPIWRVAERCGIPDAHHFNKTVRRLLGASPSAIRAMAGTRPVDPDR